MNKNRQKMILVLFIFCIALIGSVSFATTEQKVYAATKKVRLAAPKVNGDLSDDNTLTLTWKKVTKAKGYTVWIYREDVDIDDQYYLHQFTTFYKNKNTNPSFHCII